MVSCQAVDKLENALVRHGAHYTVKAFKTMPQSTEATLKDKRLQQKDYADILECLK